MLCRDFMKNNCTRVQCKFVHDPDACFHFWKHGSCRNGDACAKKHLDGGTGMQKKTRRPKNTESFEPMQKQVDMRVMVDVGDDKLTSSLTSRDVLLCPNIFADYKPGELYARLVDEIENCGVPQEQLLKLWHGDTHFIADDHTNWKKKAPTFNMVLDRLRYFFDMDVQATRFNWYKDTSQWKPFHHDAAAIKADKAAKQNFTVAVSFGATRDAAFEEVKSKTVISMPQPDGWAYCFAKDTNVLWKHGILQDKTVREQGRISIIAWGWVEGQQECV